MHIRWREFQPFPSQAAVHQHMGEEVEPTEEASRPRGTARPICKCGPEWHN